MLVPLLLTLHTFHTFSSVYIVEFAQINVSWASSRNASDCWCMELNHLEEKLIRFFSCNCKHMVCPSVFKSSCNNGFAFLWSFLSKSKIYRKTPVPVSFLMRFRPHYVVSPFISLLPFRLIVSVAALKIFLD